MDGLPALVGAGLIGAALVAALGGLVIYVRQLDKQRSDLASRLAGIERLVEQLTKNTKPIDPVASAIDSQRDFQLVLLGLGDLIDYAARISPEATRRLIKDKAPQLFEDRIG